LSNSNAARPSGTSIPDKIKGWASTLGARAAQLAGAGRLNTEQ
jgi:hypothetical protein